MKSYHSDSMKTTPSRVLGFVLALLTLLAPVAAQADTLQQLQQQQQQLQQQAQAAQQQAQQQQTVAQQAASKISQLNGQISQLNSSLDDVQGQIDDTQGKIATQDQQVADLESQLSKIQRQQDALVRQMYIARESNPDDLAFLSSDVSAAARNQANFDSLKKSVQALYVQTTQQEAQVKAARDVLQGQKDKLTAYQGQQQAQVQQLADYQQDQADLKNNAEAAVNRLNAKAAAAQAQAAQISAKIRALTATSNWGNQIISGTGMGSYYSQIGDYTRMGYSPYTVNDFGCLITSLAMVSSYYGHHMTPDYIARNGGFSGEGYYYWGTPSNLGVTIQSNSRVNWGTVNSEISAGHPVIVSIYLPSVGAVNPDGSSHYVVIYGNSNGKYLMQDPIAPSGRSYNLSQVRSMLIISDK